MAMLADMQMNYRISSVHAQWFSHGKVEQMITVSLSDITVIAHAIGGGKYIRKANSSFGAVVWVSVTEWLGHLLSHRPSTLAISVPHGARVYPGRTIYLVYSCASTQTFGNTLVSMILVV